MASTRTYLMRRAQALASELGLDDDERRELAMMLPGQMSASGPVSWKHLDVGDLATMVHWLNGATKVYELVRMRVE